MDWRPILIKILLPLPDLPNPFLSRNDWFLLSRNDGCLLSRKDGCLLRRLGFWFWSLAASSFGSIVLAWVRLRKSGKLGKIAIMLSSSNQSIIPWATLSKSWKYANDYKSWILYCCLKLFKFIQFNHSLIWCTLRVISSSTRRSFSPSWNSALFRTASACTRPIGEKPRTSETMKR